VAKLVACVGRRGGKSKAMATLVAYIAERCLPPILLSRADEVIE
jgi:hypothetical protein